MAEKLKSRAKPKPSIAPLAYTIPEAAAAIGVSASTVWRLVRDGELVTCKIRGATVIRRGRILAYLRSIEGKRAA